MTKHIQNNLPARLVLCIGAPKAGTTSLFDLMARHPEVSVTKFKESHFFSEPNLYSSGYDTWLTRGFVHKKGHRLFFDADPLYMFQPNCLGRIRNCADDVRIVVMLRNPVERSFSEYLAVRQYQSGNLSFKDICNEWSNTPEDANGNAVIIHRSLYSSWVREVLHNFPRQNVRFILFDDFISNMCGEFMELQKWLGLTATDVGVSHENPTGDSRSLFMAKLISHPHYAALRNLLGYIVPSYTVRRQLAEWIWQLNSKSYEPEAKPQLDYRDVPIKLLQAFHDDLIALQSMISMDLSRWNAPIVDALVKSREG